MNKEDAGSLRAGCLNFTELSAISVANIAPSVTAFLIISLMYSNAANASWLAYLFGLIMLIFVALNLNQFARRSASTGSMHTYTVMGLGEMAGGISAWCLVWAYLFDGIPGVAGVAIFGDVPLSAAGLHVPAWLIFAIVVFVAWFLAYRDIQLSSVLMLAFEGVSITLILIVCAGVLFKHSFALDTAQITLKGSSVSGIALGVGIAVFSLVGFENPTAYGEEAKNPLVTIPRALITSLIVTGILFVIFSYCEVLGFAGYKTALDKVDTPVNILAELVGMRFLILPLSFGAMISCFAAVLACINSSARILYSMSRSAILPRALGNAHPTYGTPAAAVTMMGALFFIIPAAMLLIPGTQLLDIVGYGGTLTAFGFVAAYFLVSIAAPAYLKRNGIARKKDFALAIVAVILLLVPAAGSVYPLPPWPFRAFPYIFLVYLMIGFFCIRAQRKPASVPAEADSITRREA
ncbi:MAG: APC family permease [Candidatus Binataceae bacterium]